MKKRILILTACMAMIAGMFLPTHASAGSPRAFAGVVGENGYVAVDGNGNVRYNLSNDGSPYYYGYCNHHHRHHRCRYVAPPRHKHHKHNPKKCKECQKHYKHHHDNGRHNGHHKNHRK